MNVAVTWKSRGDLFSNFTPGVAITLLKRLKTAKELIWIFFPRALVLFPQGLDFPSSDLEFPSAGFGNLSPRRKELASCGVAENGA